MNALDSLGTANVKTVEIVSKASPEGTVELNTSLAEGRCSTIKGYISREYPSLAGKIVSSPDGESWDELRSYVQRDSRLSSATKADITRVIDGERDLQRREEALKQIGSADEVGGIYDYLYQNYFPLIRNTGVYIVMEQASSQPVGPAQPVATTQPVSSQSAATSQPVAASQPVGSAQPVATSQPATPAQPTAGTATMSIEELAAAAEAAAKAAAAIAGEAR